MASLVLGMENKMKNARQKFFRDTKGAAAIEMAMIFPFMIFLYFGMADLTGLVSLNRKITYSADVIGDLVTRSNDSILKSDIADYYNASDLIMMPTPSANVRVELFGYRNTGTQASPVITKIWQTDNAKSTSCGNAPSTTDMASLMTSGNDLIVARVCTTYTPYVANFMGSSILGASTFKVSKMITRRPRGSLQLKCYQTTVAAGTACS
jgi:Flp pilus assembly protein TadG